MRIRRYNPRAVAKHLLAPGFPGPTVDRVEDALRNAYRYGQESVRFSVVAKPLKPRAR